MICNIFSCVSYFMVFFRFYLMDVMQSLVRKQRKLLTGVLGANPGDFISCSYSAWRRFWEGESLNPSQEDNLSCLWDAQALNRLSAHNLNVASCFRWIFSVIVQIGHGQTKVWEMGIILKIIEAPVVTQTFMMISRSLVWREKRQLQNKHSEKCTRIKRKHEYLFLHF